MDAKLLLAFKGVLKALGACLVLAAMMFVAGELAEFYMAVVGCFVFLTCLSFYNVYFYNKK